MTGCNRSYVESNYRPVGFSELDRPLLIPVGIKDEKASDNESGDYYNVIFDWKNKNVYHKSFLGKRFGGLEGNSFAIFSEFSGLYYYCSYYPESKVIGINPEDGSISVEIELPNAGPLSISKFISKEGFIFVQHSMYEGEKGIRVSVIDTKKNNSINPLFLEDGFYQAAYDGKNKIYYTDSSRSGGFYDLNVVDIRTGESKLLYSSPNTEPLGQPVFFNDTLIITQDFAYLPELYDGKYYNEPKLLVFKNEELFKITDIKLEHNYLSSSGCYIYNDKLYFLFQDSWVDPVDPGVRSCIYEFNKNTLEMNKVSGSDFFNFYFTNGFEQRGDKLISYFEKSMSEYKFSILDLDTFEVSFEWYNFY